MRRSFAETRKDQIRKLKAIVEGIESRVVDSSKEASKRARAATTLPTAQPPSHPDAHMDVKLRRPSHWRSLTPSSRRNRQPSMSCASSRAELSDGPPQSMGVRRYSCPSSPSWSPSPGVSLPVRAPSPRIVLSPTVKTRANHSRANRTQYRLVEGPWLLDVSQRDHESVPCRCQTRDQQGDAEEKACAHRFIRAASPARAPSREEGLGPLTRDAAAKLVKVIHPENRRERLHLQAAGQNLDQEVGQT